MEKTFHDKLLAFQKGVDAVKKDKLNPFHKNKYADINAFLDTVKPVLSECGLTIHQPIVVREGVMIMQTIISDGKDKLECEMVIPETVDIQKLGAAVTYLRRYSIQSLLALEAEDEDGQTVGKITKPKAKLPKATNEQLDTLNDLIVRHSVTESNILTHYGVHKLEELTKDHAEIVIEQLKTKYETK